MIFAQIAVLLFFSVLTQGKPFDNPVFIMDQQFSGKDVETRIINGQNASAGQFPYQIGMYMDISRFCGGAIISPSWVLTAAHCVEGFTTFTIFFGALDIYKPSEQGRITLSTRTAYNHENWNRTKFDNDIGVVKLYEPLQFNKRINQISLPPRSFDKTDWAGQRVRVSGWGKIKQENIKATPRLQYVDLKVLSHEECKKTFSYISEKIVCAIAPDNSVKSACNGDSGGPMVIIDENTKKSTHFAIVSFGPSNCESGKPSGYDRTYKFLDWIHEKTGIEVHD